MIIGGRDCAFKGLYRLLKSDPWILTQGYFFNQKDVIENIELNKNNGYDQYEVIWPVSVIDGDIVEIPNQDELQ